MSMELKKVVTAARDIIYFDEDSYTKRNEDTTDIALTQKLEKKSFQLIICGGGIGAGIVAAIFSGATSILGSALSARHANVLRQQQRLLNKIRRKRRDQWLIDLISGIQSSTRLSQTSLEESFIAIAAQSELRNGRYVTPVPRPVCGSTCAHSEPNAHLQRSCNLGHSASQETLASASSEEKLRSSTETLAL